MAKKKKDAISDPSTEEGSITGSPPEEEKLGSEGQPTQEGDPGAAPEEEAEVRDDASLENQLGEAQRLLKASQEREEKQYDDLLDLTRQMAARDAQPAHPQISRDDIIRREREELEEMDVSPELGTYMERKIAAEVDARVRGIEARVGPAQQLTHDSLTKRAVDDAVKDNKTLEPYRGEIEDMIFKLTPPDVRRGFVPEDAVEQAASRVAYKHRDEIEKAIAAEATKEANLNRRVEGDTASSSSQVITDGDAAGLLPFQVEFARKRGWSMDQMREANKRYENNLKQRTQQGIRG